MLSHLDEPCPLGCGNGEINWWPITDDGPTGVAYAFTCPSCGYFVVTEDQREWLFTRGDALSLASLRGWLKSECGGKPPKDYSRWPWLTCDVLGLFDLAPKTRPANCALVADREVCPRCYRTEISAGVAAVAAPVAEAPGAAGRIQPPANPKED